MHNKTNYNNKNTQYENVKNMKAILDTESNKF